MNYAGKKTFTIVNGPNELTIFNSTDFCKIIANPHLRLDITINPGIAWEFIDVGLSSFFYNIEFYQDLPDLANASYDLFFTYDAIPGVGSAFERNILSHKLILYLTPNAQIVPIDLDIAYYFVEINGLEG